MSHPGFAKCLLGATPSSIKKAPVCVQVIETSRCIEDITRRCEDMNFIFEW